MREQEMEEEGGWRKDFMIIIIFDRHNHRHRRHGQSWVAETHLQGSPAFGNARP